MPKGINRRNFKLPKNLSTAAALKLIKARMGCKDFRGWGYDPKTGKAFAI